jgi:hypothetical protein
MNKTEKIKAILTDMPDLSTEMISRAVPCSKRMVRHVRQEMGTKGTTMPKILIFDIETSPMEVYVWGLYKQQISTANVIKDWSLLSWSAKWLFGNEIMSQRVTGAEAKERKDGSIVSGLWKLLNEADIVIGHNSQRFDVRKSNFRFAMNGLLPPMPYKQIDTMKHAMKVFGVSSYKLDYLNKVFGNDAKIKTDFSLWPACVRGDEEALAKMEEYNRFDVVVTEELYLTLRPWMKGHPNVALYINTDETLCTNCGNEELSWGGYYYTPAGKYKSFRCDKCGAIGRSRISDLDKETRARLLLSVAA